MFSRRTTIAGLVATGVVRPARSEGRKHRIGALFPLSGHVAELGDLFMKAVQLAIDHVAADGLLGSRIELAAEDSKGLPQGGAVGISRLTEVEKVAYVLVANTSVSKAAAPIGARSKVTMVNGGGISPELATLSPYFWNLIPLANQEVPAGIEWLHRRSLGRVALVYTDDPLGQAVLKELKGNLTGSGRSLVGSYSISPSAEQFAALAAQVRQDKPEAIYFALLGANQQVQMIKQFRDNGIKQQLITYSLGSLPSVISLPESEGLVFTTQVSDWTLQDPMTRRFVNDWRTRYRSEPTSYGQNYYNAVFLYAHLASALDKASAPVNGDTLLAERVRQRAFKLVGGEVRFDDHGQAIIPIQVNRISAGKVAPVT